MEERMINGYEGSYTISVNGIVKSLKRVIQLPNGIMRALHEKIIQSRTNNYGYLSIRLSKDGRTRTHFVHRLLAEAYIPNPNNLPQVNHINGNKLDNSLENLEWVSPSTNSVHAYRTGLNKNKGVDHVFSASVVDHENHLIFPTIKSFAQFYDIPYSTARNALNGNTRMPSRVHLSLDKLIKIYNNPIA